MNNPREFEIQSPGISIVLPLFNAAPFIHQFAPQIEANLAINDEVIIVDDQSEDDTVYKIKKWQKKNTKVKLIKNNSKGFVNALNLGISEASNKWIARWDQDDLYSGERLKNQREYLIKDNIAVFSDFSFISNSGRTIGSMQTAITSDATKLSILATHRTAHPSAVFSKEAFFAVGGYRNKDFLAEDISLWLRLSRVGNFVSIPNQLLNYRVSSTSMTGTSQKLSHAKKFEVLNEIKINKEVIVNISKNWQETFNLYEFQSYPSRRKILFLLDLIIADRYDYKISPTLIIHISKILFRQKNTFLGISQLFFERKARREARKFKVQSRTRII